MSFFSRRPVTTEEINSLTSVWQARGLKAVFVAMACAFGAWALLLPVVPTAVLDAGGGETLAGTTTGVFMLFTVTTQVFTPRLLRKFGYTTVMSVSAFLLGFPAVGYLLGMGAPEVLTISAIRGVGFGALTVAEAAIVAELVPISLLGRATGVVGIMIGLAQMIALPTGMALVQRIGYDAVYLIAGGVGLLALVACQGIPPIPPPEKETSETDHIYVPIWRLVLVPALALMFVTTAYGAITNFLPASMRELDPVAGATLGGLMLGFMNFASMLSRYYAGRVMDRVGYPGTVMIRFQITAALGVFLIAAILVFQLSVWWMVLAALLYGLGFGAVQNEALTMMFYRLPRSKTSEAAAIWNVAYDGGTGLGSTFYGMLLTTMAFSPMFGISAAVIMIGLVVTLLDRQLGRNRVVEVNNLAARLQSVQAPRRHRRRDR